MQTHFSSYAGVPGIKVDRDLSQGTVFGEADLNRVLRKLKKVDRLANAISAVKEKSQQWNSTRAVPPLCALAGRHCLYPHVLGSNYLPVSVHSHQGCVPMPGSNTYHAYQVEDVISRLLCTAAPKWASDGNKPESSDATTIGAQYGDGNETDSSDTITRGATAVSNGIKSSPSQSRMAVHNHTSIDDGVHESKTRGLLVATSPDVAWRVSANKCSKYQVVVKVLWQYSTGQVILISWSAVHSQVLWISHVDPYSAAHVQTHFSFCAGVVDIWADPLNSQVAVFGKVNPQQVLRKLRRVNKGSMYLGIQSLDLIKAVESGDAAKASEALAQPDVDVNCCEDTLDHLPPLLWAFQSKNRSVVRVLLADHRVDVNAANILGQRALHTHWDECVSEMLHSKREDIDWNATDKIGQTPLLFHARFGNDRIIRRLIQVKSVKLCARTIDGFTALHQVVERRSRFPDGFQEHDQISSRCNIVDCLLEKLQRRLGDDALIRFVNTTDILDRSVLHYIAEEGCVDILRRLLGKCSSHMDVNSVDLHGFTPLHLAIQNGHTGVVEVLLQLHNIDANVGAVNASHLDQPMIVHKINRMVEALEEAYLLRMLQPNIGANVSPDIPDGGIEVNVSATGRPKPFELHHFDMCRPNLLSKTPKDLSSGNLTPLHLAAMEGQMDIVCLLLKWEQINVFALDTKGFSPIDYSIQKGHLEVVKLLLDKGEQRTGFDYNIQIDAAMPNLKDAFIGRVVISVRRALILASILSGIDIIPPLLCDTEIGEIL
ncbi:unnamed protein product [Sphagnum jensenii]|uniref:Uncharacterized protein n=1 Tax=Sphagnum jensenii TaxID=128206 RepID=A0ABP0WUN5_9BRYO